MASDAQIPKLEKEVFMETKKYQAEGASSEELLRMEETRVRKLSSHTVFYLLPVNGYAAVIIFLFHLISAETLLSIGLSIALTIIIHSRTKDDASFDGSTLNWVLLSFAVITPLSAAISMTFSRRDRALATLASVRSTLTELYTAHAVWDWGFKNGEESAGRTKSGVNWLEHSDNTCREILAICDKLSRWLTLPSSTRARHRTLFGKVEAVEISKVANPLFESIIEHFGTLASLCENLKRYGLPPNEATRIRQWERMVLDHVENLRMIKSYRTPQALRSFGRLFSIFVPPFYAPFYAQIAHDVGSLGLAVAFAVLTSIALTALFETVYQMEDPFTDYSILDGIHTRDELVHEFKPNLLVLRRQFFPEAKLWEQCERQRSGISSTHSSSKNLAQLRFLSE
jgi:hypothetical protein